VFFAPSPIDGSIGNPPNLIWSIQINDSEGDLFSWTIECSNGQTNSGSNSSNGTKSLTLLGLADLTTYMIWVNATDPTPGSGLYTRVWYTFEVGIERINIDIYGGFGVSAVVTNTGTTVATNLAWSINVSGGFIFSGRYASGMINEITVNGTMTIKSVHLWGIGRITITVQLGDAYKQAKAFLLGPLVLGVKQQ
jgi:hypothetical protein